jgi:hypothetical protein
MSTIQSRWLEMYQLPKELEESIERVGVLPGEEEGKLDFSTQII